MTELYQAVFTLAFAPILGAFLAKLCWWGYVWYIKRQQR